MARYRAIAAAAVLALLAGCSSVRLNLAVGYDPTLEVGSNPRGIAQLIAERECFGGGVTCFFLYDHHSSIRDGKPFNDRREQLANPWALGFSVPLWKR